MKNPITLSIGLKQFGSLSAANRWIDRKKVKHPSLAAHNPVINQLDNGCYEVVISIKANLPPSKTVEFSLFWAF